MSDRFARFINDEVLAAVLNNAEIKSAYPEHRIHAESGERGHRLKFGAPRCRPWLVSPGLVSAVLPTGHVQSISRDDDAPEEKEYPLGAWEYHSGKKLIENSEKKPKAFSRTFLGERQSRRIRRNLPQLGHGQRAHCRGPQGQGLRLSFRIQPCDQTLRFESLRADAGRHTRMDVAWLPCRVIIPFNRNPSASAANCSFETM